MAEYTIDKIEYDGNIYHLQDTGADISSTYNSTTQTVTITTSHLVNADNIDY